MDRTEFAHLFNRLMEDMERMAECMPNPSKERRHMATAMRELAEVAAWMGFAFITVEQHEAQRAKAKVSLRSVK